MPNNILTEADVKNARDYADAQASINSEESKRAGITDTNTNSMSRQSGVLDTVHKLLQKIGEASSADAQHFKSMIAAIPAFGSMSSILDSVRARFGGMASDMASLVTTFTGVLPTAVSNSSDAFGNLGTIGSKAGFDISKSFEEVKNTMKHLGLPTTGIGNLVSAANQVEQLESGMYKAAAASGQLNGFLQGTGKDLKRIDDAASSYNERIYETATANMTTMGAVHDLDDTLRKVPGLLDQQVAAGHRFGAALKADSAIIKVANAYQMDLGETATTLNNIYRDFGDNSLPMVTNLLSKLGSTASNLGIPMDIVQSNMLQTANAFKIFGDNTNAALNVLEAFGPELKRGGLGPAGISEVVNSMTQGIANMDIAHKAFISGAAGGVGGIQGAFKIDELLRQGKSDQVMKQVMGAMQSQFGGPIVTLHQATQSQGAANQYLKQIEYLKTFGLAKNNETAERILGAMSTGAVDKLSGILQHGGETGKLQQQTLDDMQQGVRWQSMIARHTGQLVRMQEMQQHMQSRAGMASWEAARGMIGVTNPFATGGMAQNAANAAATMGSGMARETQTTAWANANQNLGPTTKEWEDIKKIGSGVGHNIATSRLGRYFEDMKNQAISGALSHVTSNKELQNVIGTYGIDVKKIEGHFKGWTHGGLGGKVGILKHLFGSTAAARTAAPPIAGAVMAAPAAAIGTQAGAQREIASLVGRHPTPPETLRVEIVLKDEHMREIATKTVDAKLSNNTRRAYTNAPE